MYTKTGTVGTIIGLHRIDGKLWAELDTSGLLYEEHALEPLTKKGLNAEERKGQGRGEKSLMDKKEGSQKEMKDEGKIDASGEICGAG